MDIGRPDLPGAEHGGVIDVNNIPPRFLTNLPRIDDAIANEISKFRRKLDGFSSVEERVMELDLPPHTVDHLRDRTMFLPIDPA